MRHYLELHILQNVAPSNLNRDDTGSPKDCIFGGVRRARLSSQSLKRAARDRMRDAQLVPTENLAYRTKRLSGQLVGRLVEMGKPADQAEAAVSCALGGLGIKVVRNPEGEGDAKTQYLVFLGERELAKVTSLIAEEKTFEALLAAAEAGSEGKSGKAAKKEAKKAAPADLIKRLKESLDGGKAVDLALFGRMLADLPEANRDAACQVAHAISTHRVEREFDFYTAVDDLRPDDTSGADMLGTVEFTSSCFYRYAVIDLDLLLHNLGEDRELAVSAAKAFVSSSVESLPSGKQNSFAAHNPPSYIAVVAADQGSPRNLANAFEKPVRAEGAGLVAASIDILKEEALRLEKIYGHRADALEVNALHPEKSLTFSELLSSVESRVRELLEG
jgi:CRISPR system Cascade subunit CasC